MALSGTDTDRTKLWYLVPALTVGGTERTLVDLVNTLDQDRYDVTVWSIESNMPLASEIRDEVTVKTLDAQSKLDVTVPLRFAVHVARSRPDILQSFLYFDNVLARLVGILVPSVSVVSGVRSVPDDRSFIRTLVDRLTIPLADKIISNSVAGKEYIQSLGASEDQVHVIQNGRSIDSFSAATARLGLYESLGLDDDATIVGSVGRLIKSKGFQDLLDAWPYVLETRDDVHLVIVGDGPYRDRLERQAAERGLSDSVTFTGYRDDVPELLATFDLFVFPTHFEGFSGALLEAMAARLPIIATPVGGNTEMISDGETGLLTPTEDPVRLAERVTYLVEDQERADRLGRKAQRVAAAHFSLETMTDRFERLYERIESYSKR